MIIFPLELPRAAPRERLSRLASISEARAFPLAETSLLPEREMLLLFPSTPIADALLKEEEKSLTSEELSAMLVTDSDVSASSSSTIQPLGVSVNSLLTEN